MSETHIFLHIFFLLATSAQGNRLADLILSYLLSRLFIRTWSIAIVADVRAFFTWFSFAWSPSISFRSLHLRERRKSGRDRILPSCRQAPIGIPRRRVESMQVAHNPAIAIATAIWRPYESVYFCAKRGKQSLGAANSDGGQLVLLVHRE